MPVTPQAPPRNAEPTNGGPTISPPQPTQSTDKAQPDSTDKPFVAYLWGVTRICMGWIFLWPFMDKMFGLGHETASADSWLNGGNPTMGFLSGATGPFGGFYQDIAGAGLVNVLFMAGLLGIGVALLLGVAMKPACIAGATLVVLMWTANLPPENDIIIDDHIIYALLLIGLASVGAGKTLGLGNRWARTGLVQRYPWLA